MIYIVYPFDLFIQGGGAAGGAAKKPKVEATDLDVETEAKAGRVRNITDNFSLYLPLSLPVLELSRLPYFISGV